MQFSVELSTCSCVQVFVLLKYVWRVMRKMPTFFIKYSYRQRCPFKHQLINVHHFLFFFDFYFINSLAINRWKKYKLNVYFKQWTHLSNRTVYQVFLRIVFYICFLSLSMSTNLKRNEFNFVLYMNGWSFIQKHAVPCNVYFIKWGKMIM